jgi:hypothetical protein
LRWINAAPAKSVQTKTMDRLIKPQKLPSAPQAQPDTVRGTAAIELATVVAAWPTGVSPLAQAVDACQRTDSEQVSTDWLARARSNRAAAGFLPG